MKSDHAFVAARAAAVHCAELMARARPAAKVAAGDPLAGFSALGEKLARALPDAFGGLFGAPCEVSVGKMRPAYAVNLPAALPALAASTLFAIGGHPALLVSVEAAAVLSLVDRAFGGTGAVSAPLPAQFPMSATRMIARIEQVLARALDTALGEDGAASALRRDSSCARLEPFAARTALRLLTLKIAEPGRDAWAITLAIEEAAIPALFAAAEVAVESAVPTAAPFADLPLPLTAVLVDMRLPMRRLTNLKPGDVIPVAVARAVPLKLGAKIVATGTVGAADDRVALRLTSNGDLVP